MRPEVELLILPYASAKGRSLLDILIAEFESESWVEFWGAIGFAKRSGNFPRLLRAMREFVDGDPARRIHLTFGADVFPGGSKGSDRDAIAGVLEALEGADNAEVCLYHERGRTFHPKLYIFANEEAAGALVVIGSSNWSEGGLIQNIEVDVVLRLDLGEDDQRQAFSDLRAVFDRYWRDVDAE